MDESYSRKISEMSSQSGYTLADELLRKTIDDIFDTKEDEFTYQDSENINETTQDVADNMKDSTSYEIEVTTPIKTPKKRLSTEAELDGAIDAESLIEDPTTEMSTFKLKKFIKIEED
ncbi:hypothetical protein COCNU_scaffold010808G000010 [Cocos nucifera]|nr:hypothetical protein [Cocos nucifera]